MQRPKTLFILGLLAGGCGTFIVAAIAVVVLALRSDLMPAKPATYAQTAELARLMAAPLVRADEAGTHASEAEIRAGFAQAIESAEAIARGNTELSPIAREYAVCIRALLEILDTPPDFRPLLGRGIESVEAYRNDDNWALFAGLLGLGVAYSDLSESTDKVALLHTRIVACRLRMATIAQRVAPESGVSGATANWQFEESSFLSPVPIDRVVLSNVSARTLTDVMLLTVLVSRNGETFSNCYYMREWKPDDVVVALCASKSPWRETVAGVAKVRIQLLSNEQSSTVSELVR